MNDAQDGKTALDTAAGKGQTEVAKLLRKAAASSNEADNVRDDFIELCNISPDQHIYMARSLIYVYIYTWFRAPNPLLYHSQRH